MKMRNARLAIIVFTTLGSFVGMRLLLANAGAWLSDAPQPRQQPIARPAGNPRNPAAKSRVGFARPVSDSAIPERRGAAERMFAGGIRMDFGHVPQGQQLLHQFAITNVYSIPLAIAYLQPSCGCVKATTPKHILQPGESTTIDVRLDAGRFEGPHTENVRVKIVGDGFVSTCTLAVQADSRPGSSAQPSNAAAAAGTPK